MNETDIISTQNVTCLASLSDRFFAALVDMFVIVLLDAVIILPLLLIYGLSGLYNLIDEYSFLKTILLFLLNQSVFLLLNYRLLCKYGQTIGKRYLEIKITDLNGNLPSFKKSYGLRYLTVGLFSLEPTYGSLLGFIDIIMICKKDRRCLHDLIAGTKVIVAS